MNSRLRAAALALICAARISVAQSATDLESRLPSLSGLERARALARLVDAHKIDQPEQALKWGAEALQLFKSYPDPAANIVTLNELLWPHMAAGRYDSAAFYADSGRRFAQREGDKLGEARALSNLGSLAQRRGDPNKAVDYFLQALPLQRAAGNDREIANSLNNLGFVYSTDLADYSKSLSYHLDALAAREKLGDKGSIALSLNNIGIVYERLRDYNHALSYYERALAIRRELGNKTRLAATLNNIGDTYLEKGDPKRALAAQREALQLRLEVKDQSAVALSYRNIALIHLAMQNLDSAAADVAEARRLADVSGDRGLAVQVRLAQAAYERARGIPAQAVSYAQDALAIAEQMGAREQVRQASSELATAQEAQGQLRDALTAFKRSKAVSDSIFSADATHRIAELEQKFSDARRVHELDSLRAVQDALQVQAIQREHQRNVIAGVAALVIVIGVGLYRRRVERARLAESLSVTDSLTGLRNRRYVDQTIDMDVAASLRRWRSAAAKGIAVDDADLLFLMLDIDHFKLVNDEHGHAIGDQVLIQLGTVLRTTCRDSDVAVRWGGEEFLVIARFTDRNQGDVTAERLRQAIERHTVALPNGKVVRVTCSIGWAAFPVDLARPEAATWMDAIAMADEAAYAAKRQGRNTAVGAATPAKSATAL
jgi:diguanylate cyclase (GGDEF)-like protein